MLHLKLSGTLEINFNDRPIRFSSETARLILPILAVAGGRFPKERLAGLLWPDSPPSDGRHNLRQALYKFKQDMESGGADPALIASSRDEIYFSDAQPVHSDLSELRGILDSVSAHNHPRGELCHGCTASLQRMLRLYNGSILQDLPADFDLLREWLDEQFGSIHDRVRILSLSLLDTLLVGFEFELVEQLSLTLTRLFDSLPDEFLRRGMWALFLSGQKTAALRRYQDFTADPLNYPEDASTRLFQTIQQSPFQSPHNLQPERGFFSGREKELAYLLDSTRPNGRRLIAIIARAGEGKTRLALQAGLRILTRQHLPVFLIRVSESSGKVSLLTQLGSVLQIPLKNDTPLEEQLFSALKTTRAVILLDACEHQLPACQELIAGLMQNCPSLHLIASSREPLTLQTAQVHAMGLSHLTPTGADTLTQMEIRPLTQLEANRMFIDLLSNGQENFSVNNRTAPLIADVCHRLAGIPLAVELAAGQAVSNGVEEVYASLESQIHETRDWSPAQILSNSLGWVRQRLKAEESLMLEQLSVFAAEIMPEDVRATTGTDKTLTDLLGSLGQQYLIKRSPDTGSLSLHDAIRDYFFTTAPATRQAKILKGYIEYYSGVVARLSKDINGAGYADGARQLSFQKANIEKAITLAIETRTPDLAQRMAAGLTQYWILIGDVWNAKNILERTLSEPASPLARTDALFARGNISNAIGELTEAQGYFQEALALAEGASENSSSQAMNILRALAVIHARTNDYARAETEFRSLIEKARQAGDKTILANGLLNLGNVLIIKGDSELFAAQQAIEESISLMRDENNFVRLSAALNNLGVVLRRQGKFHEALKIYRESLQIKEKSGDRLGMVSALINLGLILANVGNFSESFLALSQALDFLIDANLPASVPTLTGNASRALMLGGYWPQAALVFGISERVYADLGNKNQSDQLERQTWLDELHSNLPREIYTQNYQQGYTLPGLKGLKKTRQLLTAITQQGFASQDNPVL